MGVSRKFVISKELLARTKTKNNPVNKSLYDLIKKKKQRKNAVNKNLEEKSVTVITCTHRPNKMNQVFQNYSRQLYRNKELIVVLNKNCMNLTDWKNESKKYKNVQVFQLDESLTYGECKNFAIDKSNKDFITFFDDDDYYGPSYLKKAIPAFTYTKAGIIGKRAAYIYFLDKKILAIQHPKFENRYVDWVLDSSMVFKREIFDKIRYPLNFPLGADWEVQREAYKRGYKLYATDKSNYVVIRASRKDGHLWKITDEELLKRCAVVGTAVQDFTKYVNG